MALYFHWERSYCGSVDRGRGLSCANANAHLIGWPISCAGHVYTRRYYRVSYWLKNQPEKYWKRCEDFARVVRSFYWLKTHRENIEKMRKFREFRLVYHWLKIPHTNFAR